MKRLQGSAARRVRWPVRAWVFIFLAELVAVPALAQAPALAGHLRAQAIGVRAAERGPLAEAATLEPATDARPRSSTALLGEVRLAAWGVSAIVTLQRERRSGGGTVDGTVVNELQASGGGDAWQFSAGRKIVGWDVGYAWRPNDVVQQEARRTLISTTAEGRPLLMAEHFGARTAWSLVWVNPGTSRQRRGADEPAMALRAFRQDGAVDWHGFARWGRRTGGSVGAAAAWVADEALELHASLRWAQEADTLVSALPGGSLARSDPWQHAAMRHVTQVLVGGTWTTSSQISLLAEAWWDGAAPTSHTWVDWRERNLKLVGQGMAPTAAVAGNLRWQASAFGAAANLHRANAFARLSWRHEAWQPSLDLLWHPTDGGRQWTVALAWQGDRWRVEGGCRQTDGPVASLFRQLPTRRSAWLASSWPF